MSAVYIRILKKNEINSINNPYSLAMLWVLVCVSSLHSNPLKMKKKSIDSPYSLAMLCVLVYVSSLQQIPLRPTINIPLRPTMKIL